DKPAEIGRAAGGNGQTVERGENEWQGVRLVVASGEVEIMSQRMGYHLRLLTDFLFHEMAVIALVDHEACAQRLLPSALDRVAINVENGEFGAAHHCPVPVFQIGYGIGEGGKRNRIRTEEHFTFAMPHRQRRTV